MIEIDCSQYGIVFEKWFVCNQREILHQIYAAYELFGMKEKGSLDYMPEIKQALQGVLDQALPVFRHEELKALEFTHKEQFAALSLAQEEERLNWKKTQHEEITRLQNEKTLQETELLHLRNQLHTLELENENKMNQERLKAINQINENNERIANQYQQKIGDYLDRYTTSQPATKGKEAELNYEMILNRLFPTLEINRIASDPHSCDIEMIGKDQNSSILFEVKNYKNNVPKQQIEKFHYDLKMRKKHGVMVSVESGISAKNAFQIDFVRDEKDRQFVALYLPNHQTNHDSLLIAVNIITFLGEWIEKSSHDRDDLEHHKLIDESTWKNVESQIELILSTYHDARIALDNAKKILDDKNIYRLKELLDMNDRTIKNQHKQIECALSDAQTAVLKEIAPMFKPVKNWKTTGRLILQSEYSTKFGLVKDVLQSIGGDHLSEDDRLGYIRMKAMRMKEWQNRKDA